MEPNWKNNRKDLVQVTNTKLTSLEQEIAPNHGKNCKCRNRIKWWCSKHHCPEQWNYHKIKNVILKKQETLKEELNTKIAKIIQKVRKDLQTPNIGKVEAQRSQMKGILIEMEDLRNRSMRSNLIIKGVQENPN